MSYFTSVQGTKRNHFLRTKHYENYRPPIENINKRLKLLLKDTNRNSRVERYSNQNEKYERGPEQ